MARMQEKIFSVNVPATSANLGPGFDCFGLALQLYNNFIFRVCNDKPGHVSFQANFPLRQGPHTNLVYKAYSHALRYLNIEKVPGLDIYAISNIPSARGLGSSASAVVAGVLAAGAVCGENLRFSEVIEIATYIEGHPDNVAPAVLGGMTVSISEGGSVYSHKLDWPDEFRVLVGIPEIKVKTHAARKVLPRRVSFEDAVFNVGRAALFIASLTKNDPRGLALSMDDQLHQRARASLIPGFSKILNKSYDVGALGCVISGSGPCILCVVEKDNRRALNAVPEIMQKTWRNFEIASCVEELEVQKNPTRIQEIPFEEFQTTVKSFGWSL
ncbi:MAG TPA: homoserine kinase [Vampirovibrionales bacterium]